MFHRCLQMHLMRMKLSFSLLKASSQVLLGLRYFVKNFFIFFCWKKGLIVLLQDVAFEIINLMINNSISVSKMHIIRQKKDCTVR